MQNRERDLIDIALNKVCRAILEDQLPDGSWSRPVFGDPRATAFYLIARRALAMRFGIRERKMEKFIASRQHRKGYWTAWPGGGAEIELTAICTLALECAQTEAGRESRRRSEEWLINQPTPEIDGFFQGLMAFNGDLDWSEIPYVSPRLVALPEWFRPNLLDLGVIRISIIAVAIIQFRQETDKEDRRHGAARVQSEWKDRWVARVRRSNSGPVWLLNRVWRRLDVWLGSRKTVDRAVDWLLAHQEDDGSFFASVHMTMISAYALYAANPDKYSKEIDRAFDAMEPWQVETTEGIEQCFTDSTIWDTILNSQLLLLLGPARAKGALRKSKAFLLSKQIFHVGDYAHRSIGRPAGAWGFQRVARHYPDIDDTALALNVLLPMCGENADERERLSSAIRWLIAMQGSDGGWASWDRNDRGWVKLLRGGRWFLRDEPCPTITSRCAMILDRVGKNEFEFCAHIAEEARSAAMRGFAFADRKRKNGLWFCRWFTHYIYGTSYGVVSIAHRGLPEAEKTDAARWFHSIALEDGGFGESPESLHRKSYVPGPSSAFHTGCALIALVSCGQAQSATAARAADWLVRHQGEDGHWVEKVFYAAGVPGVWYIDFSATPTFYAAKGLEMYRRALESA